MRLRPNTTTAIRMGLTFRFGAENWAALEVVRAPQKQRVPISPQMSRQAVKQ